MSFIRMMYRERFRLKRNCWNRSIALFRRCPKTGSRFRGYAPAALLFMLTVPLASQANSEQHSSAPAQKNLTPADTNQTSAHSSKAALNAAEKLTVSRPAQAGIVKDQSANSDEFMWTVLLNSAQRTLTTKGEKAQFETWASDNVNTFVQSPEWPSPEDPPFKAQCKDLTKAGSPLGFLFPAGGCVIEDIKRNEDLFYHIILLRLNTASGLATEFSKNRQVDMPQPSVAIQAEWVDFDTLKKWVPGRTSWADSLIKSNYYTTSVDGKDYALVALNIASKQNANWVWGSFEHRDNPGRCDYTGCFDSFGSLTPVQLPNKTQLNTVYPNGCMPSDKLRTLYHNKDVKSVWLSNYCLKSTQVDFVDTDSIPTVLGNTVVQGIASDNPIVSSSCLTCHSYAAFGSNGKPTNATAAMTIFSPIGNTDQNILKGTKSFDFMWGFKNAP